MIRPTNEHLRMTELLRGVRIVDLTRNIAGPYATMFAAEMGAEVIKVKPPGGDEMRTWPPFVEGESVYFASCNRGKRSIELDLKSDEGRALLRRLVGRADVVVENYRPSTLEKLGLGWESFSELHPKLVWVSVTGYGRDGPNSQSPAYDSMMQAFTGIMGISGEEDGGPVRSGGSPIDIATSYLAWGAIMTGIHAASRSGRGLLMEVSLMESALGFMHAYLQAALADIKLPGRLGSETMGIYPMGAFKTSNGEYCLLQVSNEHQWRRFCELLNLEKVQHDPRFSSNPLRVTNRDELRSVLAAHMATQTADQWETMLLAAGIPASKVKAPADVIQDKQVLFRNMIKKARLPNGHAFKTLGMPVKMNSNLESLELAVPALDQHREQILAELEPTLYQQS
jgi:CoA:oxalate CoA-transferase